MKITTHLAFVLALLFAVPAGAVEIVQCRMPTPGHPRFLELCEVMRVEERQPTTGPTAWTESKCASEFLRRGKKDFAVDRAEWGARRTVNRAKQNEANAIDAGHGKAFARTFCGDGIEQAEFGGACDDGNEVDGDGCEGDCTVTP